MEGEAEAMVHAALLPSDPASAPAGSPTAQQLTQAVKSVKSAAMREVVLAHGRRMDGRTLTDIRPITSRAGLLPR